MTSQSVSRSLPSGLVVAFLVALAVSVANLATGVYGGAFVAGLGAMVVVLLGVLS